MGTDSSLGTYREPGMMETRQLPLQSDHPGAWANPPRVAAVTRHKEDAFASIWVVTRPVRPMDEQVFHLLKGARYV